jgi:SAM-dependent methyltransferase
MIYRSNLTCPDLTPNFKHLHVRVMPHSFGHDVPSDWADKADDDPVFGIYKQCGMWTHDEAAILWRVAAQVEADDAIDIGCHTGWTTAHLERSGLYVHAVDPCARIFEARFNQNNPDSVASLFAEPSNIYFERHFPRPNFVPGLICIDGDHEPGKPLEDAQGAAAHLAETGVIIFHDFIGRPVREAVEWLMGQGFHCRVFHTPHMVACCWRGDFTPPDHVPDPNLPDLRARCGEFPWNKVE